MSATPPPPALMAPRPARGRARRSAWHPLLLLGAWAALAQGALQAQTTPTADDWRQQADRWLKQELASYRPAPDSPVQLRPEIEVGQLDRRLQLAPCQQIEPYLPVGTRLWGRTRIGLRCVSGPKRWNVFLPIQIKVWGPAWAVREALPAGTTLTPDHAERTEVDWADSTAAVLALPQDWVGSQTTRALVPGQVLRQGWVKPPQVFAAGTIVKIKVQGNGFSLTTQGTAIAHGFRGEPVRVRLENGRTITGRAIDATSVEVQP